MDALTHRLYTKALGNELAIAVGSSFSDVRASIPLLARAVAARFKLAQEISSDEDAYYTWNDLLEAAAMRESRAAVTAFVADAITGVQPSAFHLSLARVPISNFVDTSFDRSFGKALQLAGRNAVRFDWDRQMLGSWRQRNPDTPNLFHMLPNPKDGSALFGAHLPDSRIASIQLANIADMLDGRDLLLLNYSFAEADAVLGLRSLALSGQKIINAVPEVEHQYESWDALGVIVASLDLAALLRRLAPATLDPEDDPRRYGFGNILTPRTRMIDIGRKKQHDVFMSYFSGDADFARRLERDLSLRGLHVWRDEHEIDIGDSLSTKIQEGLTNSYSLAVVLSPEALERPWVKEELRAAYAQRLAGDFKIFPVVHKECALPPFLADYRYADFRDESRYDESLALLHRAIKNAVRRAEEKK